MVLLSKEVSCLVKEVMLPVKFFCWMSPLFPKVLKLLVES